MQIFILDSASASATSYSLSQSTAVIPAANSRYTPTFPGHIRLTGNSNSMPLLT